MTMLLHPFISGQNLTAILALAALAVGVVLTAALEPQNRPIWPLTRHGWSMFVIVPIVTLLIAVAWILVLSR